MAWVMKPWRTIMTTAKANISNNESNGIIQLYPREINRVIDPFLLVLGNPLNK